MSVENDKSAIAMCTQRLRDSTHNKARTDMNTAKKCSYSMDQSAASTCIIPFVSLNTMR